MNTSNTGNKLRIYVYGKNALNDLNYLNKKISYNITKENKQNVDIYSAVEKKSKYEYIIIPGDINNEKNQIIQNYLINNYKKEDMTKANELITKLIKEYSNDLFNPSLEKEMLEVLSKHRHFYEVLIISVDKLLDEDSKLAFSFFQGFSEFRGSQPFIFFLTKKDDNPNIQSLYPLIKNEFCDKRNIFAFKFPINNKELEIINNQLYDCKNYYHEEGNGDCDDLGYSFNILICGRAGAGKSSFINQFMQKKVAKEGEGLSITHKITKYFNEKYHIKLYDTPGFEDENTVDMVFKAINRFEVSVSESKNHLDLILYFSKLEDRSVLGMESKLLIHLMKQSNKLIFVLNDHSKSTKKQIKRTVDILRQSLERLIKQSKENINFNEISNNIIPINLRQSIDETVEGKPIIKQCFGLDILFKKIFDVYEKRMIDLSSIQNADNIKDLRENISKYEILKNIQSKEDVQINTKIICAKTILSYAKYDWFIWFGRDSRRKKLLELIDSKYNKNKTIKDIDQLFENLKMQLKSINNKDEEVKNFFSDIEKYKNSFTIEGFNFNAYFYSEKTLLIGYLFMKQFKSELGEYDDNKFKNFILELSQSFNESIKGFKKLEKEWINVYELLKNHKSDVEWINQFFIVEEPKDED